MVKKIGDKRLSFKSDTRDSSLTDWEICDQCCAGTFESCETYHEMVKLRIHLTFDHPEYDQWAKRWEYFITSLILLSTFSIVFDSIRSIENWNGWIIIEYIIGIPFIVEYVTRFAASSNRVRFPFQIMNIVDLLAILPFILELSIGGNNDAQTIRVLRVLRLFRLFRLAKAAKYLKFMPVFRDTISRSSGAIKIMSVLLVFTIVVFSALIYTCESASRTSGDNLRSDGSVSPFTSIPASFYWAVTTLTTVGYGDQYPVEPWGKFIACLTMVIGLFLFISPMAVMLSAFQASYRDYLAKNSAKKIAKKTKGGPIKVNDLLELLRDSQRNISITLGEIDTTLSVTKNVQHYPMVWKASQEAIAIQLENLIAMLLNSCKILENRQSSLDPSKNNSQKDVPTIEEEEKEFKE